jgi:DNA polymerase-3 subunit delta'
MTAPFDTVPSDTAPFDTVIGHEGVVALLREELASPAQAYLFVGPSNVGKASVAREFAARLVGADDRDATRRALTGNHPDLVSVAPEGRTAITVDQARMIVSGAVRSPLEADSKVFLLEEASMLNDEAANALLKSIEEPIASTTFVLVADSEDDLPPTVSSRCRTVVFGRVGEDEIVAGLVHRGIDEEQAERAARISGGRPGLAVALATEPKVAAFRKAWLEVPEGLTGHPGDAYLQVKHVLAATEPLLAAVKQRQEAEIDAAYPDGSPPKSVTERHHRELGRSSDALYVTGLELLASLYRDVAAAQFGAPVHNTDVGVVSLTLVTPSTAVANAERVMEAIEAIHANQRPQLALAALFVDLGTDG